GGMGAISGPRAPRARKRTATAVPGRSERSGGMGGHLGAPYEDIPRGLTQADRAGDGFEMQGRVAEIEAGGVDALVQQVQRVLLAVADGAEDLVPAPRDRQAR